MCYALDKNQRKIVALDIKHLWSYIYNLSKEEQHRRVLNALAGDIPYDALDKLIADWLYCMLQDRMYTLKPWVIGIDFPFLIIESWDV